MKPKKLKIVDLFCGAGGASEALKRAMETLGIEYELLAVNHSPIAIQTHRLNHPTAVHLCESIEHVDPKTKVFVDPVTGVEFHNDGRIHLLIAAPECTHHSSARGDRPINDQSRSMAWQVMKWGQENYIENTLIENVPEFRTWAPLGANMRPLKSRKGETYRAYLDALRSLGNKVSDGVFNAADYGDPTTRSRLFIIGRRKGAVVWPKPTHSRHGGKNLFGKTKKWRAAREVIDWSLKGNSIFGRKKPLSPKTMARIMAGLERFGGEELKPFLIVLRNHADARPLDQPLPTLSAQGQHMGLVEPSFLVPLTHGGGLDRVHGLGEPMPTVTCAHRGELALIEPFVLQQQSGGVARPTDQPLPTIATDGAISLVEPFIVGYHSEKPGEQKRTHSVEEPIPTLTTENRFGVVEPFMIATGGPIGRGRQPHGLDEPLATVLTENHTAVVEPFLVPHFGERPTQAPRTHSIDAPVPTIAATGQIDVVQSFLVSAGGPKVGPISTESPMNTVLTRDHMALVEGQIVNDPNFLTTYYGNGGITAVTEPVPTITTKDRCALVMPVVNGRALDIRLRMLKPHELARAMSFGDQYKFAGNQGDQVKQIGNAWPCRLGQALIETLLADYAQKTNKQRREEVA